VHHSRLRNIASFLANDEDDFSFLKEVKQSGIPQFVDSLASLAKERQDNAIERLKTQKELFFDRIGTTLRLIQAQWAEEGVPKRKPKT